MVIWRSIIFVAVSVLATGSTLAKEVSDMTPKEIESLEKQIQAWKSKWSAKIGPAVLVRNGVASARPNTSRADLIASLEQGLPPRQQPQNFYLRSDPLDAFGYPADYPLLDGKGASLSYSNNQLAKSQSISVNAFTALVLDRVDLSNGTFAYAPFLYATGTASDPERPASERNALQAGLDFQLATAGPDGTSLHAFRARPYYQTDYRGDASIYGVSLVYEPYYVDARIGGRQKYPENPELLAYYLRVLPEFNYFKVDDPGRTGFIPNREYALLGGTLQLRSILFSGMGPDYINSRFYFNGSVTQFWNATGQTRPFHDSEMEFGYIISRDKPIAEANRLTTSISFVYNNGYNRNTFEQREQYKVQLNVQY